MTRKKQIPTLERRGVSRDIEMGNAVIKVYEDGIELVEEGWVTVEATRNIVKLLACNRTVAVFEVDVTLYLVEVLASKKSINDKYEYLINVVGAREIS